MRSILRMGLSVVLATVLAVSAAWAVTYDDIFELTERAVSERTIVQLIVDDGRAFDLSEDELADLRAAGVSQIVIDAMLDPAVGKAWLAGDVGSGSTYGGGGTGYSTSLDQAYNQGYSAGVGSTALVYSFGYYYGPLSRYYYTDPFYYPFWSAGYSYSYWPSYYSYWWRPSYASYYSYPYNWYSYSSYYCHSYYDPGYWAYNGYTVQPGYGHTVWDDGPRFRGGGIVPPKGGRPDGNIASSRLVTGSAGRLRNPAGPPAIREAEGGRTVQDRTVRASNGAGSGRSVAAPGARTPSTRSTRSSGTRVIRGSGDTFEAPTASARRGSSRSTGNDRVASSQPRAPRMLRESADRVMRGERSASTGRTVRRETPNSGRIIRSSRDSRAEASARARQTRLNDDVAQRSEDRGSERSRAAAAPSRGHQGERASAPAPAPQTRGGHDGGDRRGGGGDHGARGEAGGVRAGRGGR